MLHKDTYAAAARIKSMMDLEKRIKLDDFDFSEPKDTVEAQSPPAAGGVKTQHWNKCRNLIFLFTILMALSIGIPLGFYLASRWDTETPIEDVVQEVDIVKTVCLTEADCKERMVQGYGQFIAGDFPVSGCFSKDGDLYWGRGDIVNEAMDSDGTFFHDGVVAEDVFCLTHITPTNADDTPRSDNEIAAYKNAMQKVNFIEAKCLTEADCEERMTEGYDKFEVGDFPLSGCFSKDGILYWGTGEKIDESIDIDNFFQS